MYTVACSHALYSLPFVDTGLHQLQKIVFGAGNIQLTGKILFELLPYLGKFFALSHNKNLVRFFIRMIKRITDSSSLNTADFGIHAGAIVLLLNQNAVTHIKLQVIALLAAVCQHLIGCRQLHLVLIINLTAQAALNKCAVISNQRHIKAQLFCIRTHRNVHSARGNQKNLACVQCLSDRCLVTRRNPAVLIQKCIIHIAGNQLNFHAPSAPLTSIYPKQ